MPPGAALLVEASCRDLDPDHVINTLSRTNGVHAAFLVEEVEGGGSSILIMWRSLGDAIGWIEGGGLDSLLGGCVGRIRLFKTLSHVHGPAHPRH